MGSKGSWMIGAVAGVAHIYMAAVWGGYVFVINLIGLHAGMLALQFAFRKDFNETLHRSYSLFYIIGTIGATRVPVVGWTPVKSLEQMMPMLVFVGMQVLAYVEIQRKKDNLNFSQVLALRVKYALAVGAVGAVIVAILFPTGYFGPLSSRVRGLFVKHTRTGNPLVDSVAEHQPADARAYWSFLHYCYYLAPFGLIMIMFGDRRDSMYFLVAYSLSAYFFSAKMMRLVLLAGPVASALTGVVLSNFGIFCLNTVWPSNRKPKETEPDARVMAWWDYGYQITGIANRTTIADGNTWNHEHIATLGRALTAPLKDAHRIVRHLADYVLVWAGGGGDDLAKSPHIVRIANSVYRQMCPGDPTCSSFSRGQDGRPSPMMAESFVIQIA